MIAVLWVLFGIALTLCLISVAIQWAIIRLERYQIVPVWTYSAMFWGVCTVVLSILLAVL